MERLTKRELEVVTLLVQGKTDKEIGELLKISPRTVSSHVSNMLRKLGLRNRVELTRRWQAQQRRQRRRKRVVRRK